MSRRLVEQMPRLPDQMPSAAVEGLIIYPYGPEGYKEDWVPGVYPNRRNNSDAEEIGRDILAISSREGPHYFPVREEESTEAQLDRLVAAENFRELVFAREQETIDRMKPQEARSDQAHVSG